VATQVDAFYEKTLGNARPALAGTGLTLETMEHLA
jgi:hypothetical protein